MSFQADESRNPAQMPMLIDPSILRAARHIYRLYNQAHHQSPKQPLGVAIDPESYRGHIILGRKPILLPREKFVSRQKIEAQV